VENGFFASVAQSGLVGQAIVYALLVVSVYSWAIIIYKGGVIRNAVRRSGSFHADFRGDPDGIIGHYADGTGAQPSPFASILEAAHAELELILGPHGRIAPRISQVQIDGIERSIERAIADQVIELRSHLIVLATTAGVAPFVGLFGTVWGIMKAFTAMSLTGTASISSVAPGVSAALMNQVRNLIVRMENFSSEVVSTIERNFG
jgi:biopolymer transport protein TolQ